MARKQKARERSEDLLPSDDGGSSIDKRELREGLELSSYLPFRVGTLSQRLLREAALVYKGARLPLTTPQWMVLCIVAGYQPLVASEISRISLIDEVGVSRVLMRIEKLGLVTRTRSRRDQRVLEISLTAAGWALYHELAAGMEAQQAFIKAALTQEEFQMLLGLIDRLDAVMNSSAAVRRVSNDVAEADEITPAGSGKKAATPDPSPPSETSCGHLSPSFLRENR